MKKWIIAASSLALFYVSGAGAGVECLSGDAARNAFVTDSPEPYFSQLQPREMAAKTGMRPVAGTLQQQRDRVRSVYLGAVLDCTPEDIKGLEGYAAIIDSAVKPVYPGLVALPWRIVKVKDTIEGGLPHTRGSVIVLSASLLKSIALSSQQQRWEPEYMNLFIHERVHVIQRIRPNAFAALYEQQWGFRKAGVIRGAEHWLAGHQVVNPDAVDVLWVWPVPGTGRIIWPRVLLAGESATPSMPDDFLMAGIELVQTSDGYSVATDDTGVPRFRNLADESAYMKEFAGISSLYHPNEIAADYLADLAMWDCFVDKSKASPDEQAVMEEGFRPIRLWAQQTFAH